MEQLAKAQKPKGKVEETEAQPKKLKGKKPVTKAGAKKAPGKPGVKPKASAKSTASKGSTLAKTSLVQRQHLPTGSCTVASKDAFAAGGPPKDATVVFLQTLVASGCLEEMPGKNGSKPDKGLKGETILPNHTSLVALGLQPLFSCVV